MSRSLVRADYPECRPILNNTRHPGLDSLGSANKLKMFICSQSLVAGVIGKCVSDLQEQYTGTREGTEVRDDIYRGDG